MKIITNSINYVLSLKRFQRRLILILIDINLLCLSYKLSEWLYSTVGNIKDSNHNDLSFLICLLFLAVPLFAITGQYKGINKYLEIQSIYRVIIRNILLVVICLFFSYLFEINTPLPKGLIIFVIINSFFIASTRFILRDVLVYSSLYKGSKTKNRIAIYGAGVAAAKLAASIKLDNTKKLITFLDDNTDLWGRDIGGIPINSPKKLIILKDVVDQILLAIPSISNSKRLEIIERIQIYGIPILSIPSFNDITSGKLLLTDFRPIEIEDLLGRDTVIPDQKLLGPGITNSVVCVTGAGGSIGSELCRQVLKLKPSKLIILDNAEYNLYKISQELNSSKYINNTIIKIWLGDCKDSTLIKEIFINEKVDIVFHSAAYKHVPLVENNPLQGIANNAFSTRVICEEALSANIKKMILISTDKAVRPTNIMGASKRLAELIVQAYSDKAFDKGNENITKFSMVRFGNVLNSSGSVVPLFKNQISKGGPITITHPEVVRYFMTIPEAAQLVIQATSLAKGGDLFILDMGEPIKIKKLAEQMIRLSGFKIKNENNFDDGDIKIIYTGLRPGEKLFEELLIDAESIPTSHPLIYTAIEKAINSSYLFQKLSELEFNVKKQETIESLKILKELVPEWESEKTFS